jgi:nitrate/nitrite transporter NarK
MSKTKRQSQTLDGWHLVRAMGPAPGSAYRMIPSIFRAQKLSEANGQGEPGRALALKAAGLEAATALGFIGGVGACGGYLIPRGVRRLHCRNRWALSRA